MAQISLRGKRDAHAVVDDVDLAALIGWQWSWIGCEDGRAYAIRPQLGGAPVYMHRQIMKDPKGLEVDHRDGDGLNNQRSNLRVATRKQNGQNLTRSHGGISQYRGVAWSKQKQKWVAQANMDGKHYHLGLFDYEEDAALASSAFRSVHMPFSEADQGCGVVLLEEQIIPEEWFVVAREMREHGCTYKQIAEATGVNSASVVHTRLKREREGASRYTRKRTISTGVLP